MSEPPRHGTYRDAGVSIEANERAVELIAKRIADAGATRPEVLGGIGGFSGAFAAGLERYRDPVLLSGTDGVGTKLKIAQAMGRYDTVGWDAVAMVVDDIACDGGEPLFVLDYVSCGRNDPERTATIVGGVAEACAFAGCALLGGEISEHPGVMDPEDFDLVAFAVGVAERDEMLGPGRVRDGDVVIGLASTGLHSNGYSLVRTLILDHDLSLEGAVPGCAEPLGEELLRPCRVHVPAVLAAARATEVHAVTHVTQGGIPGNLARALPEGLGARLDRASWETPAIFAFLQETGGISDEEMQNVFNLGVGMAIFLPTGSVDRALEVLTEYGERPAVIGRVGPGRGVVIG